MNHLAKYWYCNNWSWVCIQRGLLPYPLLLYLFGKFQNKKLFEIGPGLLSWPLGLPVKSSQAGCRLALQLAYQMRQTEVDLGPWLCQRTFRGTDWSTSFWAHLFKDLSAVTQHPHLIIPVVPLEATCSSARWTLCHPWCFPSIPHVSPFQAGPLRLTQTGSPRSLTLPCIVIHTPDSLFTFLSVSVPFPSLPDSDRITTSTRWWFCRRIWGHLQPS